MVKKNCQPKFDPASIPRWIPSEVREFVRQEFAESEDRAETERFFRRWHLDALLCEERKLWQSFGTLADGKPGLLKEFFKCVVLALEYWELRDKSSLAERREHLQRTHDATLRLLDLMIKPQAAMGTSSVEDVRFPFFSLRDDCLGHVISDLPSYIKALLNLRDELAAGLKDKERIMSDRSAKAGNLMASVLMPKQTKLRERAGSGSYSPHTVAFVRGMAEAMWHLFGETNHLAIATLAGIVFDDPVDVDVVRMRTKEIDMHFRQSGERFVPE